MICFLIVLALSILSCFLSKKKQNRMVIVTGILMILLCGLRANEVGADTDGYFKFAEFATSDESSSRFGILYLFLRNICSIFNNSQVFIFIISLFTIAPLVWLIRSESPLPAISLLVFMVAASHYYLECFNIIRQQMSVVIVFLSLHFYFKKKYPLAIILFVLSFLSHKFAFFIIPIVPFLRRKISFPVVVVSLSLTIILGYIGTLDFLTDMLVGLNNYASESAYNVASLGNYVNIHDLNSKWSIAEVITHWFPISVICLFGYRKDFQDNWYNLLFIGALITNLLMSNTYCDRIASYFTMGQIFIAANTLSKGSPISKIAMIAVISFYVLFYLYTLYIQNLDIDFVDNVMPYRFFFER